MVVHCAANTGFHVPLDEILATNTIGFVELLNVAAGCKRLKVRLAGGMMFERAQQLHSRSQR